MLTFYKHKDKENHIYLNPHEVTNMVNAINYSNNVGLCKYAVNVWLVITMKDGGEREFRVTAYN